MLNLRPAQDLGHRLAGTDTYVRQYTRWVQLVGDALQLFQDASGLLFALLCAHCSRIDNADKDDFATTGLCERARK